MGEIIYQGVLIIVADGDTKSGFRVVEAIVTANGVKLPPSHLAHQKTRGAYAWGYGGSGPAALAHSMLVYEYTLELGQERAEEVFERNGIYHDFKQAVIAPLPSWDGDGLDIQSSGEIIAWTLTSADVRAWVEAHRDEVFPSDTDDEADWMFQDTSWQEWGEE